MTTFDDLSAIDVLDEEVATLLLAARSSDPAAGVPLCPGWTVLDLAVHVAGVYRWVEEVVSNKRAEAPAGEERRALFADPDPGDAGGVLKRLRDAAAGLADALRSAPGDLRCWTTWSPPSTPRAFWLRRMVHETVIHRVDAENARDGRPAGGAELATELAADGVDELVLGFARRYAPTLRAPQARVLSVHATDADLRWWAELGPDAPVFGGGEPPRPADAEVRGTAGELLLLLWNRRDPAGLEVAGAAEVLDLWRAGAHL